MTNIRLLAFPLLLLPLISGGNVFASDPVKAPELEPAKNLVELRLEISESDQRSGVTYDSVWGVCSIGAVQLLRGDEVQKIAAKPPVVTDCDPVKPLSNPRQAEYPAEMIEANKSGSAQVVALIDEGGHVVTADAVCVSEAGFAALAENVIRAMQFAPARCGVDKLPVKSVIILPVSYDVHHQRTFLR
ncbi:energy transducer TonB [uncultured Stenotrophomonas sp.]|uniref:energy transducer TonB n=1 Tax=uncultured Stenotrophomonas sp. TaxID=165438 RepID=UPI0025D36968|nr:energy transducer TonB [uncultured Stenotrophomonas sp.]